MYFWVFKTFCGCNTPSTHFKQNGNIFALNVRQSGVRKKQLNVNFSNFSTNEMFRDSCFPFIRQSFSRFFFAQSKTSYKKGRKKTFLRSNFINQKSICLFNFCLRGVFFCQTFWKASFPAIFFSWEITSWLRTFHNPPPSIKIKFYTNTYSSILWTWDIPYMNSWEKILSKKCQMNSKYTKVLLSLVLRDQICTRWLPQPTVL